MSVLIAARAVREMQTCLLCWERAKECKALAMRDAELWWRLFALQHKAFAHDHMAVLREIRQATT